MRRRILISRAQHQFWLAHKIAFQQPLVARIAKHRRIAQETDFASTTADVVDGVIALRGQDFKQSQQIALPPLSLAYRPAFVGQPERDYEESLSVDELAEFSEQPVAPEEKAISESIEKSEAISDPQIDMDVSPTALGQERMNANQFSIPPDENARKTGQSTGWPAPGPGNEILSPHIIGPNVIPYLHAPGGKPTRVPILATQRDGDETDQQTELATTRDSTHLQKQSVLQAPDANMSELETSQVPREEIEQSLMRINLLFPSANEAVAAQSQQEHADTSAQPVENVKAKRQRGHIQEQSAGTQYTPHVPGNESSKGVGMQTERSDQKRRAADDLFVPRDIDRSPQTWMEHLARTKSAAHGDTTPSETQQTTEREEVQVQVADDKEIERKLLAAEDKPLATMSDQFTNNEDLASTKKSTTVESQANLLRNQEPTNRLSTSTRAREACNDKQVRTDSTPLSQHTIRFLQPLVGINPANIRVHRDALAERLTDHYQADAITIGNDVEVAAGYQEDTPETLGLLAHEFTHVARRQEAHFMPPIARSAHSPLSLSVQPSVTDEETLAQQVEGRVKRIAQEQIDQVGPTFMEPPDTTITLEAGMPDPIPAVSSSQYNAWGGLPAPWEPLPDWIAYSPTSNVQATTLLSQPAQMNANGTQLTGQAYESNGVLGGPTSMPGNSGVQRAGQERSSSEEDAQSATSMPPDVVKAPEPDLDALARQVYTLLKRRLGVEYRRGI